MKGTAEACDTYILPLIIYCLAVLPLCRTRMEVIKRLLTTLLWGGRKHWVRKEACFLRRVLTEDSVLARMVRDAFLSLTITPPIHWVKRGRERLSIFLTECRSALKVCEAIVSRISGGDREVSSVCRAPDQLVTIDLAYACDNVSPSFSVVVWTSRPEVILRDLNQWSKSKLSFL